MKLVDSRVEGRRLDGPSGLQASQAGFRNELFASRVGCREAFIALTGRFGEFSFVLEAVSELVLMLGQSRGLLERVSNPGQVAAPPSLQFLG